MNKTTLELDFSYIFKEITGNLKWLIEGIKLLPNNLQNLTL